MSNKNQHRPCVLTIAATDSAGMAGIGMDIRTQTALGCHTLSVISANTAQNNEKVLSVNAVSDQVFDDQIQAILHYPITVIKIGLLANIQQLQLILKYFKNHSAKIIYDPVLSSTSGHSFYEPEFISTLKDFFLPRCDLITPNIHEARLLTNTSIEALKDFEAVAKQLIELGCSHVFLKGGHTHSDVCRDYFTGSETDFWLASPRIDSNNTRGTGCALASSVACALALNYSLVDAIVIGKMCINQGLEQGFELDTSHGPVCITHFPNQQRHLPKLYDTFNDMQTSTQDDATAGYSFSDCSETPLGLYPIVDRAEWLNRLLPLGVTTLQLRIKDLTGQHLSDEIAKAVHFAKEYHCRLFINDHWQLAIEHNAYGVHLGQEDIKTADLDAIHQAGLRLGISSHCYYEVARANTLNPSYIACGPIFPTTTKIMPWQPQGIEQLNDWNTLLDIPLVAIGGIKEKHIAPIVKTGTSGIAMITAITLSQTPEITTRRFLNMMQTSQKDRGLFHETS